MPSYDDGVDRTSSSSSSTTTTTNPKPRQLQQPPVIISDDIPPVPLSSTYQPSVTVSIFITWILPVLVIALLTRFAVDPEATFVNPSKSSSRPITIDFSQKPVDVVAPAPSAQPTTTTTKTDDQPALAVQRPKKKNAPPPTLIADKPTGYIEIVQAIQRRRLDFETTDTGPMEGHVIKEEAKEKPKVQEPPRGASSDPVRNQLKATIDELRREHQQDPTNLLKLMEFADALRMYDVQYHDGGTAQQECITSYQKAIDLALHDKQSKLDRGMETNRNLHGTVNVAEELVMDYSARSIDGILCTLYTALGKVYFMANMFEKAIESYSQALQIEPLYLDAMSARGSSRIIVGDYEGAGQDFTICIENDVAGRFLDVYTGLARVLQAKESAVPQGWEPMIDTLQNRMIPALQSQYNNPSATQQTRNMISNTLNRLYHVLFLYHDVKTKEVEQAWQYLTLSYQHKMSILPAWNAGMEAQKIAATKQIFHRGFWPPNVGSSSKVPIFIIGFVRSGSTLLERVLDAHPQIVGTGENSVFNGRLDEIRNKIVETSMNGDAAALVNVIESLADGVVDEMKQRWEMVASAEDRAANEGNPERYVDKMLTNYYNVGFIHMLFPNALILHVAREPMDTIFSAYKHEFPPGPLDYTSEFAGLAELYHGYRDLMEHWDRELPGRVTHVRYEDLVHDMPGVAKQIIAATGLEWDESVLDFHKKKHAVNTLSTTQVRKGIYKDSLQAWRRYESQLSPLVELIGERTVYDLKTSLPGYVPPSSMRDGDKDDDRAESNDADNKAQESTFTEQDRTHEEL
ncbi:sulfotransferase [Nitzschia inconspicua]|uniref:Sulfotransferase n=1 Tax=Nitzschia inconspicua TaxID=303405 RepID=A0A9K3LNJ6_9STRA|nr:sulfotransferase [Nitzschia inconspicua]